MDTIYQTVEKILHNMEVDDAKMPDYRGQEIPVTNFNCGSPGAIPMFCLASEIFSELKCRCLRAAENAGKLLWK
jgi:hypothetical protein